MLSKDRQLPVPLTSSVHLSLSEARYDTRQKEQWRNIKMNAELHVAIDEQDVERMRRLAKSFKQHPQFEHEVGALIYAYAIKKDAARCALVLKHVAPHASPMLDFWMSMVHEEPQLLEWIGQHDDLARYIFLPMPCPNREWCLEHQVDRQNPKPAFRAWWESYPQVLRRAVNDHLRVEWRRRFVAQPKLYYLLDTPTVEQAVFAATRPEPVWDMPVLAQRYPDIQSVYDVTHALYQGAAATRQMAAYFEQADGGPAESYLMDF